MEARMVSTPLTYIAGLVTAGPRPQEERCRCDDPTGRRPYRRCRYGHQRQRQDHPGRDTGGRAGHHRLRRDRRAIHAPPRPLPGPGPDDLVPARAEQGGVIFVHGFCDSPDSFLPLEQSVKSFLISHNQGFYRSSTDYISFYNGSNVEFQLPQTEVPSGQTNAPLTADQVKADDPAARFFLVALDGTNEGNYWNFDPSVVAQIPIYEKGNELAHIIWAIKDITGAPRVIVVAHSMGGLDTRAYIEGLATPTDYASTDVPYVNDIASLVTLDTPHRGACTAALSTASTTACFVNPSDR